MDSNPTGINLTSFIAHNGEEAVTILDEQEIHMVVTDLKMPKTDDFSLVAYLSAHHPEIPFIIMTTFGTPDTKKNLKEIRAFQYIEKPIDFNLLIIKIKKDLQAGPRDSSPGSR